MGNRFRNLVTARQCIKRRKSHPENAMMKKAHNIEQLNFVDEWLLLNIDGQEYRFRIADISPKLEVAADIERNTFRVMASGYGIHWPLLDEDLSVDGLLDMTHTPPRKIKHQEFEAALNQANRKYGNMLQRLADNTICKTKE